MNDESINYFRRHLEKLPAELHHAVLLTFEDIVDKLPDPEPGQPDWLGALPRVLSSSDYIAALLRRNIHYLTELIDNGQLFKTLDTRALRTTLVADIEQTDSEEEIMSRLRRTRHQAMLQIAFRDLAGWSDLPDVMTALSHTADVLLSVALQRTSGLLSARYGTPVGNLSGQPQRLVVLGMGKLGGGELNFSSDVDLIFCFPENGETDSEKKISNSEYFTRQARLFIKLIGATTADGFVYRVDTRLRPNGDSGPLTLSFAAMESYYQTHGRDWERYAFIKARVVAGDCKAGDDLLASLRPFVYRKYLDYAALESIREMKESIESELAKKHEIDRNVKLGPGGIREIEFIAQAHQLIRGGREKSLQQRSLLLTLRLLLELELISQSEYDQLMQSYDFLRRSENRIQMFADQQTHNLPVTESGQLILARSMGYNTWPQFHEALQQHMVNVHGYFRTLFMETAQADDDEDKLRLQQLWNGKLDDDDALKLLQLHHYQDADSLLNHINALRNGPIYRALSNTGRNRLDRLLPVLLQECAETDSPDKALLRLLDLLASISRRAVYLSLLLDNQVVRTQLIQLCQSSAWISTWLARHPILLDDLLSGHNVEMFQPQALLPELNRRLAEIDADDLEQQMTMLREFHHAKVLAIASLDVAELISAVETGQALTAVAEASIHGSLNVSRAGIVKNHGTPVGFTAESLPFCVIGYGKLGSAELGYGSDLDMVFLSGNIDDTQKTTGQRPIYNAQFFARLGQRMVHVMTTLTPAGRLYEVDMRLRPSGNSGPLVATLNSFERYQKDKAWTWEHQALIRARVVCGETSMADQFNRLRRDILCQQRDAETLRNDVLQMREKMRAAGDTTNSQQFDLKQGHGGIVDIEFMVQYMVLRWAHDYPQLTSETGTIALLDSLSALKLIELYDHRYLVDAFTAWLKFSYELKLDEQAAVIPASEYIELRRAVTQIWKSLFGLDMADADKT